MLSTLCGHVQAHLSDSWIKIGDNRPIYGNLPGFPTAGQNEI